MTHKVHPKVFRIREIGDWDTRGFYRNQAEELEEDFKIREFLKKKLGKLGIEKIEIERFPGKINVIISSSRPGLIIGRGGERVQQLKDILERKVLKEKERGAKEAIEKIRIKKEKKPFVQQAAEKKREIKIEIREVKNVWASASLSAQWVAQQLEKRIRHRRVLKQAISKIAANKEVQGVRAEVAGRLNGAEIARREWLKKGRLPLQTIRAQIEYGKAEAFCSYGVIGVKVWIYKGDRFE